MLDVMERILSLDSIACVESALHGLGHAHAAQPRQVERIIDRYLAQGRRAGAEITAYAQAARRGCVL
jgi:Glu-tRNA(Gln) amidotransferase subunit E-like FAD-binding protein